MEKNSRAQEHSRSGGQEVQQTFYVPKSLRQQVTHPRQSQSDRLCKQNDTKLDCVSAIGQGFLKNEQCKLNDDNK